MIKNILLISALLACSVSAQQAQKIRTNIVTFGLGAPAGGFKAFFKNGEEIKPFSANGSGLSAPISYEGPRRFEIRASEEAFAPPPAGQPVPPPLAFVDLPERVSNILILTAPEGQGKLRLIAYDVSSNALKAGEYKIFNFSRSTIGINLDKQKLVIKPAQNEMMRDQSWHDPKPKALAFAVYKLDGQQQTLLKRSPWEHWATKRTLIFLFDGSHKEEPIGLLSINVEEPPAVPREGAGGAAARQ